MTREQAKTMWPIIKAFSEGATIQAKFNDHQDSWSDQHQGDMGFSTHAGTLDYRVKPESMIRPWRQSEVPIDCWLRSKASPDILCRIVAVGSKLVTIVDSIVRFADYQKLLDTCEHSCDGGKTWSPCGVMEAV